MNIKWNGMKCWHIYAAKVHTLCEITTFDSWIVLPTSVTSHYLNWPITFIVDDVMWYKQLKYILYVK